MNFKKAEMEVVMLSTDDVVITSGGSSGPIVTPGQP